MGELTFDDFRKMATDPGLSRNEKIGFPESYREGFDSAIVADISAKVDLVSKMSKTYVDIGCGCGRIVNLLIDACASHQHRLILIDSQEMLDLVPNAPHVIKIPGRFPDVYDQLAPYREMIAGIVCYSVFHYVYAEMNYLNFIHDAISLLEPEGRLFIGDVPNTSKRQRFIGSKEGKKFLANNSAQALKGNTGHDDLTRKIDDAVINSIVTRFRNFNCETYLLPQPAALPMSNRRDDILIVKR